MPIRHFDIYLKERRLRQTTSLNALKGTSLGIDGQVWLKTIMSSLHVGSCVGIGGLPFNLKSQIEAHLKLFKKYDITPIIIFSGITLMRRDKPFSTEDYRPNKRTMGWNSLKNENQAQALDIWAQSKSIHLTDLIPAVMRILESNSIEFIRAPYSSLGQIEYLYNHRKQPIHAIYGSSDLFMFNIDSVITNIDFEKETFGWVTRYSILSDLRVSKEQFLDICIMAGFEWCPTFPVVDKVSFTFKDVHDLIKMHYSGYNVMQTYFDDPDVKRLKYIECYSRAYCAIKHHLVLRDDGVVSPLNASNAPNDLHEVFGYRLPDQFYYLMSRGIVHPHLFNPLNSGSILEYPPLDNGESIEYRTFITTSLLKLNAQVYGLYTNHLHSFYMNRKINVKTWFDPQKDYAVRHSEAPKELLEPVVIKNPQGQTTDDKDKNLIELAQACTSHGQTPKPDEKLDTLKDIHDTLSLTILRNIGLLDLNKISGQPEKTILDSVKNADQLSIPVGESLVLALTLIKEGVLTSKSWSVTYDKPKQRSSETDNENAYIRLISRTASLLPVDSKPVPWEGPFDRDLLAFNSAARTLNRTLGNMGEATILSLLLSQKTNLSVLKGENPTLKNLLPFQRDLHSALGTMIKFYLTQRTINSKQIKTQQILNDLQNQTPTVNDILANLKQAMTFFQMVAALVKQSETENKASWSIPSNVCEEFEAASTWLNNHKL
ncbi:hypothetical protein H4219_000501 [Mycoemilia scoparia]|uniref:XPG N-terminal domain-containing protein n=1 Tax=Mycoemilia scoparia TaxID=417184 RepID=A0A9W8A5Y0_9FUNG|nr:hypothetical protein H4219_000501 [Mycoemilia scoparia]